MSSQTEDFAFFLSLIEMYISVWIIFKDLDEQPGYSDRETSLLSVSFIIKIACLSFNI